MNPRADERRRERLTRRGLLRGGCSLALLGLGALACRNSAAPASSSPPAAALRHTRRAMGAALVGNLAQARQEVDAALRQAPAHGPALLVRACLALEEGQAREVEDAIAQLKVLQPERPEPRLLERLLAHRQRAGTGWRQGFLSAWAELGRPDLRNGPLLPEPEFIEASPPVDAWHRAPSAPVRLALVLAASPPSEEQVRWLVAQVPHLDDAALVIAADNVLRDRSQPEPLHPEAAPVLRAKLAQLIQAHPRSMQLRLLGLLADSDPDAALGAGELADLEALSALPRWREHAFARTFQQTRRSLEAVGWPHAGGAALGVATLSVTDRGSHLLRKRAEATRAQLLPGARGRLGRILWSVGARMAEESTLVEHMVGLQFMLKGAKDMQDEAEHARVTAQVDAAHALLSAEHRAALDGWPLPSLREEVLEAHVQEEWARLRDFAEPSGVPPFP